MTLLQIDKRAASAKEGLDLINRTYDLHDPLGTPTLYVSQNDVDQYHRLKDAYKAKSSSLMLLDGDIEAEVLSPKLKRLLNSQEMQSRTDFQNMAVSLALQDHFTTLNLEKKIGLEGNNTCSVAYDSEFNKQSDHYKDNQAGYRAPLANIVICSGETSSVQFAKYIHSTPLDIRMRFHDLWHEIGHGTGAGEPQADMIAAVVTRQSFEPSHVIKIWADERGLNNVLGFTKPNILSKYGWGCVDVNDYIANQSEQKIRGLSEEQIKAIRFQPFDNQAQNVFEVARSMRTIQPDQSRPVDLMLVAREAEYLASTKFNNDDVKKYICQRFALACMWTQTGHAAYDFMKEPALPKGKYPSFEQDYEL